MPTNLTGTRISDTYQQVLHVSEGVTTEEKPVVSGTGVASTIRLGTESMSARQLSLDVPLAITSGGTDANNPPDARYNLGCGDVATTWYPDPPDGTVFLAGDATWKPAGGGSVTGYLSLIRDDQNLTAPPIAGSSTKWVPIRFQAPWAAQRAGDAVITSKFVSGFSVDSVSYTGYLVIESNLYGMYSVTISVTFQNSDTVNHTVYMKGLTTQDDVPEEYGYGDYPVLNMNSRSVFVIPPGSHTVTWQHYVPLGVSGDYGEADVTIGMVLLWKTDNATEVSIVDYPGSAATTRVYVHLLSTTYDPRVG
jgi:hypothetical protein